MNGKPVIDLTTHAKLNVQLYCRGGSSHGWTGRPHWPKSWGWSWLREAVCLGHGGELSLKSL